MNAVMSDFPRRHRITVDEYYRMAEVGLIAPDARTELIDGVIFDMAPIGIPHASAVNRLTRILMQAIPNTMATVVVQNPVRLNRSSQPQPDFAIARPRDDFYSDHHPTPEETLLVIEVSDSTLGFDLNKKGSLYAQHGIPEYWVVDLNNKQLCIFRNPSAGRYADVSTMADPCTISTSALPGVALDLSGLFGLEGRSGR